MSVVTYFCNHYAEEVKTRSVDAVYKELGKRIVDARKAKNMSQEKLASESGMDRSHLGFIEQGRRRPTVATLVKLTDVLGLSLERLFKGL
jgi:transcriptional regulator with XRE-family HTH domain